MTRNKLYTLLAIACFFGYIYLGLSFFADRYWHTDKHYSVCFFKNMTSYPCPSCGTTRAVKLLAHGEVIKSVLMNPLGVIVGFLLLLLPFWIAFDLILKKQTLLQGYKKFEKTITNKWVAIALILLILLNWYWNIQKHL